MGRELGSEVLPILETLLDEGANRNLVTLHGEGMLEKREHGVATIDPGHHALELT